MGVQSLSIINIDVLVSEYYYLYILFSDKIERFYIGVSHNPEKRLRYHNLFPKGWTKRGRPWR
ncbi:GIY-YIG nuclease family protein, partial [bacterium]|nr:GIY-YIG nuclease family protein [bacterium]